MDVPRILGLMFTPGMTLKVWKDKGLLGRELDYYRELNKACPIFDEIWFFTWDTDVSGDIVDTLADLNIKVITRPKWIGGWLYGLALPFLQARNLRRVSVMRSQRVLGGALLPLVRLVNRVPTFLRGGLLPSEDPQRRKHPLWRRILYGLHDWTAYTFNNYVGTTSPHEQQHISNVLHVKRQDILVMPNYVDTDKFTPRGVREPGYILFVGRLHPVKQLSMLIRAVSMVLGTRLHLVGDGPQRAELESLANELAMDVEFVGAVSHEDLPEYYARASVFVLPSRSEGNPKTLLEAMACGAPSVASDIPAVRDMAVNEKDALLVRPSPENIATAIRRLVNDAGLAETLSHNARNRALADWSLQSEVVKHCRIYRRAIGIS